MLLGHARIEPRRRGSALHERERPLPSRQYFRPIPLPADPDDPDQVYEIERILSAKKEGGRFMILVK